MRIYNSIVDEVKTSTKKIKNELFQKRTGYITSSELKDKSIKKSAINSMEWF